MKIPYTLVSMAAILRDYVDMSDAYKNTEHKRLVDIADSLYNVGMDSDEFLPAYKELYSQYGKPYFDQVLDDMYALDSQLTSDAKVQELIEDYEDRLSGVTASTITCSTDAEIENLWCDLTDVPFDELPDGRLVLAEDWKQFPAGTDREDIWHFFDRNHSKGVAYLLYDFDNLGRCTNASTKVTAATNYDTKLIAKWLKAKFDDEAFGTAYTMHRISDADAYMSRNGLTYNRKNNTIDLWKSGGNEDIPVYKVIPQYSSTKRQGTYAPKMPKLVPIDEWNATHGVTASTKVTATEDNSYNQHLVQVSKEDKQYVLNNLNDSHKTVGMGGAGDPGYYVSEFEPAYGMYLWASDTGLRILDDNGIEYTEVKKSVGTSTKVTASINLIDKLGYIKNRNGKFDICLVETPFAEMELATYDPIEDEYDILTKVKDVADAYDQANKLFKTQDEYVINSSTKVTAATNSTGVITGPYDTSLHYDLWYGDKFVPRKYGADAFVSGNGEYRGNIFDDTGATIGDYYTDNSVLIEKNFLIDFGE